MRPRAMPARPASPASCSSPPGPGATNMVTPLTDALMDSIPLVCITGQVPTHLIGNDAFQECDTVGITRPCTKHNWLVRDVNDLSRVLHEAFYVATTGRPGPGRRRHPEGRAVRQGHLFGPEGGAPQPHRLPPGRQGPAEAIRTAVALMARAERPLFYTGGGVINSGPAASQLLRELVAATGFPITSTLMGLGAYPASGKNWLGMLGMHGTYEANMAMHDCDLMICIGARFDDRITGRIDAFSPGSRKIHVDVDASSINKNIRVDVPIVGDAGQVMEDMLIVWRKEVGKPKNAALEAWWDQIDHWRRAQLARLPPVRARDHAAIRHPASLRGDQGPRHLHHHRGRPAPDVGGAVLRLRGAEPLDDLRRPRHHGLRPAGGDRRAGGASGQPRHRHRRRRLGADDDAGDVDRRAARAAGQDLHPEQPVHGHGAAVAAAAARQPPVALLHGLAAGLREARRGLWLRRHARRASGRARRRDRRDDPGEEAGHLRLPRRQPRKLLPDDPLGQGAQRDAASGRGDRRSGRRGGRCKPAG